MKNYRLHFIRHGITKGNNDGVYIGRLDIPLSDEGKSHLDKLDKTMDYPYAERVYTSPLDRCRQSADIIYPHVEKVLVEDLTEMDFGDFQGRSYEDLKYDEDFVNWLSNSEEYPIPNGEVNKEFLQRIITGVNAIFNDMMASGIYNAAVFTHGGVIMNLFSVMGLPRHPMSEWITENGKGYTVLINPQMWTRDFCFEIYDMIPKVRDEYED